MSQTIAGAASNSIGRRQFLKTSTGLVAVTILSVPLQGCQPCGPNDGGGAPILKSKQDPTLDPGFASQRIDGFAKVTGQKIYARDFSARDMEGWPDEQWYALYLRATTTASPFLGLDLSDLPDTAKPHKVFYGDDLKDSHVSPVIAQRKDLHLDEKFHNAEKAKWANKDEGFDRPDGLLYDLIVKRKNQPDFLGQAVALLIFSSKASYRQARKYLQFQDDKYQRYDRSINIPRGEVDFTPKTHYVRIAGPSGRGSEFSYATNPDNYDDESLKYAATIEKSLNSADGLIRQDFETTMQAMDPMFMEPESGIAWYQKSGKTLHMVLGTQSPDGDVRDVVTMYGEPDSPLKLCEVRLTSCYPGGGFGGRDSSPFSLMLALAAAFTKGKPLKLEYDRFEQFQVGLKRHAATVKGALYATPDRKLKAVEMTMGFDGGGRRNLSPYVASLAALCAGGSYNIEMADIAAKAYHSENISGGSQRGFGGPQAFFAIETAMDDIARSKDWDPIDFRLDNILTRGGSTVVGGVVDQDLRLRELLDIARTHPVWAERDSLARQYSTATKTYGTGIAMSLQAYGTSGDGVIAAIRIDREGRYTVFSDAVDMGNGSATTLGVVIGESLGANASEVAMADYNLFGQTGLTTDKSKSWADKDYTRKAVGSSSACLTGLHQVHVVKQAARALFLNSILPAARTLWNAPDLTEGETLWRDGFLTRPVVDGEDLSLARLASHIYETGQSNGTLAHAYFQGKWVSAEFPLVSGWQGFALDGLSFYYADKKEPTPAWRRNVTPPPKEAARASRTVWAPCVNLIGLTVNRVTGDVQIEKSVTILNAGKIHVEPLVSGQSQGGLAMAISYTLLEDMPPGIKGPANGTYNLNRYHVARMRDVPLRNVTSGEQGRKDRTQELIILPVDPKKETSGRGIAEAVMCSVAPAISNAIADATGQRFTSLPITAKKIRERLRGKGKGAP